VNVNIERPRGRRDGRGSNDDDGWSRRSHLLARARVPDGCAASRCGAGWSAFTMKMHVQLEHSELLSFAETVLREIDVDRHLEVFKESLLFRFKDR